MPHAIRLSDRFVGRGHETYIVAEIGINHNGSLEQAKRLIDIAALAGCDAVKFQKRTPELCVPPAQRDLMVETPWGQIRYIDYRHKMEFNFEEYAEIDSYCRSTGIMWFASAWDEPSVDFLEQLAPICYKIPSPALTDRSLLERVRATNRPVILSTGMSKAEQIEDAVLVLGTENLLITHCTSIYPCPPEQLNLLMIPVLGAQYDCPIGYSGHEAFICTTIAAVALGASLVERHITLDRTMWGRDQSSSLDPTDLAQLVSEIRLVEMALGNGEKMIYEQELDAMARLRRASTL